MRERRSDWGQMRTGVNGANEGRMRWMIWELNLRIIEIMSSSTRDYWIIQVMSLHRFVICSFHKIVSDFVRVSSGLTISNGPTHHTPLCLMILSVDETGWGPFRKFCLQIYLAEQEMLLIWITTIRAFTGSKLEQIRSYTLTKNVSERLNW